MRIAALFLFAALTLVSCKKEDDDPAPGGGGNTAPACETSDYGWIRFDNNTGDTYRFHVDNVAIVEVPPYTLSGQYQVNSGARNLYALQLDGWILFPTEYTGTAQVVECNSYDWDIP